MPGRARAAHACCRTAEGHRQGTLILYGIISAHGPAPHPARRSVLRARVGVRRHSARRDHSHARRSRGAAITSRCARPMPATRTRACACRTRRTAAPDALDVRILRNLSNALAYHWQLFAPLGLVRTHPGRAAAHRHRAPARLPQPARGSIAARPARRGARSLRRLAARHRADHRAAVPRQADLRRHGRARLSRTAPPACSRSATPNAGSSPRSACRTARITLLPNPIDEREFDPAPDGARFRQAHGLGDAPLVLLLAKLTPRKGAGTLLRAFARLDRPDARLVIAGSDMGSGLPPTRWPQPARAPRRPAHRPGPPRRARRRRRRRLPVPRRGVRPGAARSAARGTPVIVCNDSGAGEIIGTVGGGHIVPPGDDESLAGAIESMLAANGLVAAAGAHRRARACGSGSAPTSSAARLDARLSRRAAAQRRPAGSTVRMTDGAPASAS